MSDNETLLAQGLALLEGKCGETVRPEPNRADVRLEPAQLPGCVEPLAKARWGYLSALTGLDYGPETGRMEALYHFCNKAAVITLRVQLPREKPVVPSVCGLIPSATLFERELQEMFGIVCEGTPDPRRLFLADDWPDGVYPLRKDFVVPAPPPAPEA
jgi:Ni,Fe-hydrogenase III component G